MWIKNFLKLILIIFSCFSSLLLLFTFGTYFYFFNKNNLSFIDKKGYLSNIISWYVGKEIKFNTISFNINDFNSKHNIIITDFESTDYKNFSEIKVGILSFDCHFIECIRSYQNYTNLNLVKPTMKVVVSKKENYNNNSYYEDLINFIDKAKITNIKDGTVNIHYLEHINEFSNINITKKNNDNDLSIFGYFSYRSNKYADKSDFNIGIYKDEYKSHINIKFYSFAILNSIFESYEVFPFSVSDTLIDGDVNIKVKNGNAETIDFNIISNTGTVILEKSKF